MLSALNQGASDLVSGVGKTVKNYISTDAGKAIEAKGNSLASKNYKSASEQFIHPDDGADKHTLGVDWSALPRAAVEQAPALASDVAGQVLTKRLGPVGQWLANTLTFGARTAGGEAEKRAQARTGDANAEPTTEDKLTGLTSTLAQSALNKMGTSAIVSPSKVTATGIKGALQAGGNVAKAAATEGVTNAAQDAVSQGFAKRGTDQEMDPAATKGALIMGALGGGVFSMPHAAKETITVTRMRNQSADEHTAMAANRITEAAGGSKELSDPTVAFDATKRAVDDVRRELSDASKSVTNPSQVAANAIDAAKRGDKLSQRDLAAVDAEGNEQLSSLVRQATALSKLVDMGNYDSGEGRFAGGGSEFARKNAKAALFGLTGIGALPHIAAQGGIGLDTLSATLPHVASSIATGYGGYRGLKVLDKMLGTASPAQTFANKFGDASGNVRVQPPLNQSPTGPKVVPQNSLTTPQPWGPVPEPMPKFKPDVLEPGIAKIVEKLQRQKQQQTAREAMPLLRQLAQDAKPAPEAPGLDASALNEQIKGALLMASARRKLAGQMQAEAEAEVSPMIQEQGGLEAVRNPAMGKRAQELISAANALARLRRQPEEEAPAPAPDAPETPPTAPEPSVAQPKNVDTRGATPTDAPPQPEPFVLPESPHVFKEPKEAAEAIYNEAVAGGKTIRHAEGFKAGTTRRLAGEEAIYNKISTAMPTVAERGAFHKYLAALWGSDSPDVVSQVREHMLAEFPQHAGTIMQHLSDEAIKGLWTKPKKK